MVAAMRQLQEAPGGSMFSRGCRVVATPGQVATVETGREVSYIAEPPSAGEQHDGARWIRSWSAYPCRSGRTSPASTRSSSRAPRSSPPWGTAGSTARSEPATSTRLPASQEALPDTTGSVADFQTYATDYGGDLFDGNTATILAADDGERRLYQLITVERTPHRRAARSSRASEAAPPRSDERERVGGARLYFEKVGSGLRTDRRGRPRSPGAPPVPQQL